MRRRARVIAGRTPLPTCDGERGVIADGMDELIRRSRGGTQLMFGSSVAERRLQDGTGVSR
jgi:hypothetical protein